ncbi:hypothetical protein GCM10020256_56380 [Streptomyces thermocoprophilus]
MSGIWRRGCGRRGAKSGTGAGSGAGGGSASGSGSGSGGPGAGRGAGGGVFRTYRIDRFNEVVPLAETFVRDAEFDLPGFWAEQADRFARSIWRGEAVVRLTEEGVRRLPHVVDPLAAREALASAGAPDGEGRVTVTVPVESEEVAHAQLTALGPEGEVLAPRALRERLAADARRLAELYGA